MTNEAQTPIIPQKTPLPRKAKQASPLLKRPGERSNPALKKRTLKAQEEGHRRKKALTAVLFNAVTKESSL